MAEKLGGIYIDLEARMDKLNRQLNETLEKGQITGKKVEDAFQRASLRFNDSLAKKSIAEIEVSAEKLRAHLQKKIEIGAPLGQLEALKSSLDKAEHAVATFKQKTDEVPASLNNVGQSATGIMGSLKGIFGALGGMFAIFQVFSFLKDSVEESKQAAQSLAKVSQAIKTTGGAAGFTAEQLSNMASELEDLSGIDGDQIMNDVTAQLLTFTNISGDQFRRAQRAAMDLATVIGTDLKSQTIQLGKALEDPVTGMTALRRAGVTFTEAQQNQIKALVASNNLFAAQGVILKEIETKYGGQAEAANKASGGTMSLAVAWGNLKEQLGNSVMPVLTALAGSLSNVANKTRETSAFWLVLGGAFKIVGGIIIALKTLVVELGTALGTVGAALVAVVTGKFKLAQDILGQGWKQIVEEWKSYDSTIQGMWNSTGSAEEQAAGIKKIIDEINAATSAAGNGKQLNVVEEVQKKETEVKKALDDINSALKQGNLSQYVRNELIAEQIKLEQDLAKYNKFNEMYDAVSKKGTFDVNSIKNPRIGNIIKGIPTELKGTGKTDKPEVPIKESNFELERSLALSDALDIGFQSAGNSIANAMGQAATVFKQANSMLQIFVNGLVSAAVQALALKAVMAAINFFTGGIGGILGGASAASPVAPVMLPTGGASAGGVMKFGESISPMLGQINQSINALNVNVMKQKPVKPNINVNIDGKKLVLDTIGPEMESLSKQNYLKS